MTRPYAGLLCALLACACKGGEPVKTAQEQAPSVQAAKGPRVPPESSRVTAKQESETVDGYQVIRARTKSGEVTSLRVKPPKGWDIMTPPSEPDPHGGKFTLEEALEGLPKEGQLAAHIETNMGSFYCDLYADKAPITVANFVGLARGKRKFWDAKKLEWTARKYYDGTEFHRVIPGFMIQGGDHTGSGKGGIGYVIPDELHPSLKHDRAGQLCAANRGPNTNEAQFFITEGPAPHLDSSYTIFGRCEPTGLVKRIARVPQKEDNRPITPVVIERVEIKRMAGGATAWMPAGTKQQNAMPDGLPRGRAVQVDKDGKPVEPR